MGIITNNNYQNKLDFFLGYDLLNRDSEKVV